MEKEINKDEAKEASKTLEEGCEHSIWGWEWECLLHNEMCYYENQTLCPNYAPKYINKNKK